MLNSIKRRCVLVGLLNFILLMNLNCEAKSVLGDVFKQTVGEIAEEVIQNDRAIHRLTQTVNEMKDTHVHQEKQLNKSLLEDFLDLKSIIQVDECASNPCIHGLCRDFYNGFSCHCSAGYTGITCGSVDDCPMNACGRNGRCIDLEDDYKCWNRKWGKDCQHNVPRDCYEIKKQDTSSSSGMYNIVVNLTGTDVDLEVYCDMETDNGGWTVFQRRLNGSQDFSLGSDEYEIGFGRKEGEFWLGLKWLHAMTSNKNYTLRVDLSDADDSTAYQTYEVFRIGDGPGYVLSLTGTSSGTAGNAQGLSYHNGYPFVTKDNSTHSCLINYNFYGGWWYKGCAHVTLNDAYITPGQTAYPRSEGVGIFWYSWLTYKALKTANMKIRPLL